MCARKKIGTRVLKSFNGAAMTTNEQVEVKLLKDNKNPKTYSSDLETITLDNTNDAENNNSDAQQRKMWVLSSKITSL